MSVQVSYKKQFTVYLVLFMIVFLTVEAVTNIFIKSYVLDGCAGRLDSSGIYSGHSKDELKSLCKDYYDTNVFISDDSSYIIQFPSHSKTVNINSLGLRGDEIQDKQDGVTRILMLGGSTTFGWYALDDQSTIPAYLEKKLNENGKFEVINGGHLNGASFFETNLLERLSVLEPDIVIVYDGYNDITTPLPSKTPDDKIKIQMLIKQFDSYTYTPRAVEKIIHEIQTKTVRQFSDKLNTLTEHYTEKDYVTRADLWEKRWSETCDKFSELKIFVFLQPILGSSDRIMTEYEIGLLHKNAQRDVSYYQLFRDKIPAIDSHCTKAVDISDAFDDINHPMFSDLVHTGSHANELIADRILKEIQ